MTTTLRTKTAKRPSMDSQRKTALVAGALYLLTFVSIPTLALYGPVRDRNYIVGPGPDTNVYFGGVLEMIVALACIGTAVVLYSVIKRANEGIALGFGCHRVSRSMFAAVEMALLALANRVMPSSVSRKEDPNGHQERTCPPAAHKPDKRGEDDQRGRQQP